MWTVEQLITTPVPRPELWRAWSDVETWPSWDPRSQWIRLDGPLKVGQTGRAKFRGRPAGDYRIVGVEPGRSFALEVSMPLVKTRYEHRLADARAGTEVCQRVTVTGPLASLFGLRTKARIREYLPEKLRALAEYAETSSEHVASG
jgi:uncharacterized protein YndB with AHSA1/START domain